MRDRLFSGGFASPAVVIGELPRQLLRQPVPLATFSPFPGCGGFFGTVPHALFDEATALRCHRSDLKQCPFHGVAAFWLRREPLERSETFS